MSSPYHHLFEEAKIYYHSKDDIQGNRVYYECRKGCNYKKRIKEDRQIYYAGTINGKRAKCISIDNTASALEGRSVNFYCNSKPGDLTVFQMSNQHRGKWGILEEDVRCWIRVSFYPNN